MIAQTLNLRDLLNTPIDWRHKCFPPTSDTVTLGTVGEQKWNVLDRDLLFPVMVIKEAALDHNISLMARYCHEHGVSLAPHAKTPMSPQIVQRQLDAGAWALTVANIAEARVFRAFGVGRLLMANQLIESAGLTWIARELDSDPNFDFYCLVDSVAGTIAMGTALQDIRPNRPIQVLIEMGASGGRAGCRNPEDALAIAEAVRLSAHLALAGVEGYEGVLPGVSMEARIANVGRFLLFIRQSVLELLARGMFPGQAEIIVSAGGSIFFDRVAEVLGKLWNIAPPVRVVVRPGTYVTHDCDTYERGSPLAARGNAIERLQPALELWSIVLSRPEPDLAILGFGKRDVSYDLALPFPFAIVQGRERQVLADGDLKVTSLNDQHAFVRISPGIELSVGDIVGSGISHPCTAFDKWRVLPLVDNAFHVTGAIQTFF